jgi:hypothetical protein
LALSPHHNLLSATERNSAAREGDSMTTQAEPGAELSDVELLRRALRYSRLLRFDIVEKWHEAARRCSGSARRSRGVCAIDSASTQTNRQRNDYRRCDYRRRDILHRRLFRLVVIVRADE